ncbi:MAG: BatD family protein [Planctomycetaceae bacterium]
MSRIILIRPCRQSSLRKRNGTKASYRPDYSGRRCSLTAGILAGLIGMLLTVPSLGDEQQPEIRVGISAEEIFIGETIDYQVEIRNAENPSPPDISPLQDQFKVVSNGDQSRNQSTTLIINGRVSEETVFSHVYLYRLTPKVAGDLTIHSVKATIDGKELSSRPLTLRVLDAEVQDLVITEIRTDRQKIYPTQPFSVSLKILLKPLPESDESPLLPLRRQPPQLQIGWLDIPDGLTTGGTSEWLQPLMSQNDAGFRINEITASTGSFFGGSRPAVFGLPQARETRNGPDGHPINYFSYELTRQFTPEKTGRYEFGPALVKGTFVDGINGREFKGRKLVAIAPAVSVEVREVPTPRPATFTGGIGEFLVAASANPMRLRVGDPLTLNLEFARGSQSGSLELISAPDLSAIPEIAENFEIIDKAPTGRVDGDIKKFAYGLRPKRAGVSVPSLTLTNFDPSTEAFTEISTEPISLEVAEAASLSTDELVGAISPSGNKEIRKSDSGIFQNITDPAELQNDDLQLTDWLPIVGGFWCLSLCSVAGVIAHRRRSNDSVGQRRLQARKLAQSRLLTARQFEKDGNPGAALRQIRAAILGLVADTQNLVAEGLTAADVGRILQKAGLSVVDQAAVTQLLESLEGAEYGGGEHLSVPSSLDNADKLIDRISPVLQRRSPR